MKKCLNSALTIALLLFSCRDARAAQALTLQEYLAEFLSRSDPHQEAKLESQRAREQWDAAHDPYLTLLSLTPLYGTNLQKSERNDYSDRYNSWSLESQLTQEFPTATRLSVGYAQLWALERTPLLDLSRTEFSVRLSQPLARNGFGSFYKKKSRSLEASFRASQSQAESKMLEECSRGAMLYSRAFILLEKSKIYDDISDTSAQALRNAQVARPSLTPALETSMKA